MSGFVEFASLIASLLLFAGAIVLLSNGGGSRGIALAVSGATFVFLVLSGIYVVANHFTGEGINDSVIFHLRFGLEGAGFGDYTGWIIGGFCYCLLVVAFTLSVHRSLAGSPRGKLAIKLSAYVLMLSGLAINPANRNLLAIFYVSAESQPPGNTAEFARHYWQGRVSRAGELKNLVFLYVESLERTYLDPTVFPGLAPNLSALLKESQDFTDIAQAEGTGWTIAGMVASQCGTPPFLPAADEEISLESTSYMPGATCMGDLMAAAGYHLEYLGGASLEFAEKGNFLRSHGFARVQGKEELLPDSEDPDYFSDWGLFDDTLFQIALRRVSALSQSNRPFGLFLLTLDTHHNGYESEYCEQVRYGDGENPILNAVHCTDQLLAGFIDGLRNSPAADQTVIVVASDHLAMRNSAWEVLTQQERRNLFLVIDPSVNAARQVNRPGTIMDVGPTVLSQIGLEVAGLGFGRNLLSPQQSLRESVPDLDRFLARQKPSISALWR